MSETPPETPPAAKPKVVGQQKPTDPAREARMADRKRKLAAVAEAHYKWEQKAAKERTDLWDPEHTSKWGEDYPNHHLDVEATAEDQADFWDEVDRIFAEPAPGAAEAPGSPPVVESEEPVGEPAPDAGRKRAPRRSSGNPAAKPPEPTSPV